MHAIDAVCLHHGPGDKLDFEGVVLSSFFVRQHDDDAFHALFCLWEGFEFFVFGSHSYETGEECGGEQEE